MSRALLPATTHCPIFHCPVFTIRWNVTTNRWNHSAMPNSWPIHGGLLIILRMALERNCIRFWWNERKIIGIGWECQKIQIPQNIPKNFKQFGCASFFFFFLQSDGFKLKCVKRCLTFIMKVEKWWEDYAYCTDRTPIFPFAAMAAIFIFESVNVEISPRYCLKVNACLEMNTRL